MANQRRGHINMQALEAQFKRNREVADNISRYKRDASTNKTVINGCLVFENGRFRRSGSSYMSIATPRSSHSARSLKAPSIKLSTSKIRHGGAGAAIGLNDSRRSSKASLRSKVDSHKSLNIRNPIHQFKMPKIGRANNPNPATRLNKTASRREDSQRSISRHSSQIKGSVITPADRPHKTYTSQRNQRLLDRLHKYN